MNNHLHHQISDILAQMDQDADIPTLHVILMDASEEDKQVIESTIEAPDQQIPEVKPFIPASQPARNHPPVYWLVGGLATLPTLVLISLLFLPVLLPVVTVTIKPVTKLITTTSKITVTTSETIGKDQLAGRLLSSLTERARKTVPTTGVGHQEAQSAHGLITFYNAALVEQIIPEGTMLTAASGIQIVTDETAIIPPGTLSTNGQVTITAHALEPGTAGNIRAGDLYGPCCRVNVFVTNGAFTGGQEARSFPMVAAQDIDQTAQELQTSLYARLQAALERELRQGEALIKPSCQSKLTHDHNLGEETEQIDITVQMGCTAVVYRIDVLNLIIEQKLTQQITKQLGDNYRLTGEIKLDILQGRELRSREEIRGELLVRASGHASYQFSQEQLGAFQKALAGKNKAEAMEWLERQRGVQTVRIDQAQLPTSSQALQIVLVNTTMERKATNES